MVSWIESIIEDDEKMPQPENSEISPNEILETVQSVFNFLGGVFNFLAEREKNSQDWSLMSSSSDEKKQIELMPDLYIHVFKYYK